MTIPRRAFVAGGTAGLTLALTGCSDGDPDGSAGASQGGAGGVLRLGYSSDITSWDPAQATGLGGTTALPYLRLVYDTLLRPGSTPEELLPGVAQDWETLDDRSGVRLTLVDGLTFDSGAPVDAEAVRVNVAHVAAAPSAVALAVDVTVEGPRVVVLRPERFSPYWVTTLANLAIADPAAIAAGTMSAEPAGTGPYRYLAEESSRGQRYVFQARDEYRTPDLVGTHRIEIHYLLDAAARLNALRDGAVDVAVVEASDAAQAESLGFGLVTAPSASFGAVIFDREGDQVPALAIPEVREAMSLALDRTALIDAVLFGFGEPSVQPFPAGVRGHDPDLAPPEVDVDRARELLRTSGFDGGFTVRALTLSVGGAARFAEALQGAWAEVGITVDLAVVDQSALFQAVSDPENHLFSLPLPQNPPEEVYELYFSPQAPLNTRQLTPPASMVELNEAIRLSTDDDERRDLSAALTREMVESAMIIVAVSFLIAAHAEHVDGLQFNSTDPAPSLLGVTVAGRAG